MLRLRGSPTLSYLHEFDILKQLFGFYIHKKTLFFEKSQLFLHPQKTLFFEKSQHVHHVFNGHKQFVLKSLLLLRLRLLILSF